MIMFVSFLSYVHVLEGQLYNLAGNIDRILTTGLAIKLTELQVKRVPH